MGIFHPAQVVNTMDKVMWCYKTENVLKDLEQGKSPSDE